MPGYKKIYKKDESFDPIYKSFNFWFFFKSRILSALLMSMGFIILSTQVIIPLVFFKTQDKVSEPAKATVLGVATGFSNFEFKELKKAEKQNNTDLQDLPKTFLLDIPKLNIENALVETNSTNLNPEDILGHYKGSALPGNPGNSFIYGHSVLPWFFNPKNYKTIFSTLDNLKAEDNIYITFNGKKHTYKVELTETKEPENVFPTENYKPDYLNESTITLMTCWPAGTRAKRLMVRAVLIDE